MSNIKALTDLGSFDFFFHISLIGQHLIGSNFCKFWFWNKYLKKLIFEESLAKYYTILKYLINEYSFSRVGSQLIFW